MSAGKGTACARHYLSGRVLRLNWEGARITGVQEAPTEQAREWWVAPALFDVQVNGFAGVDFQSDCFQASLLLHASRALRSAGCTRYLVTLITDHWDRLIERLRGWRRARAESDELRAAVAGWHLEGPFLCAKAGYHGAHDPGLMLDPTPERIRQLRALTEGDLVLLTLAPERRGGLEAIRLAARLGMKVSLGHTNASQDVLAEAVKAGASGFTHLGNACPQRLHRHDNIVWRVLETRGLVCSLIPDAIHVSPSLFRLVHALLPRNSIMYTTDAMAAAGSPPGRYTLGGREFQVGEDGVVRAPGESNYSGSALRPIDGVLRAAGMLGAPWQAAWKRFSDGPARWLGLRSGLAAGQRADFCLIKASDTGSLEALRVFAGGEECQ
jgi:N-acetylglucosamine-6-phosphate deacetylase